MQITRIVSGGQSGADIAGLDATFDLGIPHGGYCPKGRKSEDGPIPPHYKLIELSSSDYAVRTERNVMRGDGTIVFTGSELGRGSRLTIDLCARHNKPCLTVRMGDANAAQAIRDFLAQHPMVQTLNVAGSRESTTPGIYEFTHRTLLAALGSDDSDRGTGDARDLGEPVKRDGDAHHGRAGSGEVVHD